MLNSNNILLFVFSDSVVVIHRAKTIKLVHLNLNVTHIIEGELSSVFVLFCQPQSLSEILTKSQSRLFEIITEFMRLSVNNFIVPYNHPSDEDLPNKNSFWEDAYIYHLLSRTTKASQFLSRPEQHNRFLENVSKNQREVDSNIDCGTEIKLTNYLLKRDLLNASFLKVLFQRRTKRIFGNNPIPFDDFSWIIGATWGYNLSCIDRPFNMETNLRTSPSCGGLQSINVYPVIINVDGIKAGIYKYSPERHSIRLISSDISEDWILSACAGQEWVSGASAFFIMTGKVDSLMWKYNVSRLYRMLHVEAGHFSQTFLLCAEFLGKAACLFGAMNEEIIELKLGIVPNSEPLLFINGLGEFKENSDFENWISGKG